MATQELYNLSTGRRAGPAPHLGKGEELARVMSTGEWWADQLSPHPQVGSDPGLSVGPPYHLPHP